MNGEPTGRCPERACAGARVTAHAAVHDRDGGVSTGVSKARAWAATAIRIGPRPEPIGGPASFSSFPRGTCLLSVSRPYLALDEIYRSIGAAFPNNPTRRQRLVVRQGPATTGAPHPPGAPFQGTWAWSAAEDASPDYNSDAAGARFSSWAFPGSLAVTRGILVSFFSSASLYA
ncbi:hypothetical protein D5086_027216 [Populus alba]|uniref:Uncharacterized protein n=1 Tax=Populus alba TaxID=43335 RepID=A0ACC4B433_POPAL